MNSIVYINIVLLWLVIIFIFLLILAVIRKLNTAASNSLIQSPLAENMLQVGETLPKVEFQLLNGTAISPTQEPKERVLVFVAPDCGACKDKVDELNAVHRILRRTGTDFMVVSLADKEKTKSFVDDIGLVAPTYVVPIEENVKNKLKIASTPMYYYVSQEGNIIKAGPLDYTWQQQIHQWVIAASD